MIERQSEPESPLDSIDRIVCGIWYWRNVLLGGAIACLPVAVLLAILLDFQFAFSRPWLLLLQLLPGFLLGASLTASVYWLLDRLGDRVGRALEPDSTPRWKPPA